MFQIPEYWLFEKREGSISVHYFDFEHQFEFDNASILFFEPVYAKRMISEMIHISLSDTVNFRTDPQGLCATYSLLLKKYNDKNKIITR